MKTPSQLPNSFGTSRQFWSRNWPNIIFLAIYLIPMTWFATLGTFRFLEFDPSAFPSAFDSLAQHMLEGRVEVDQETIGYEAFAYNGKTQMYFGPWPAFLRVPLNLLFPHMFGLWTRPSVWFASIISLLVFMFAIPTTLSTFSKAQCLLLSCGFALGTPLLFMTATPSIYHESTQWGLAGAMLCVWFSLSILNGDRRAMTFLFLTLSFCVVWLSRAPMAVPWLLAVPVLYWKRRRIYPFWSLAPFIIGIVVYLAYNQLRFGSPFTFYNEAIYASQKAASLEYGTFNLHRLPDTIRSYWGFPSENFSTQFPFIYLAFPNLIRPQYNGYSEQILSLTLCSPWLLVLAAIGFTRVLREAMSRVSEHHVINLFMLSALLPVMTFSSMSQRYCMDFIPTLVMFACYRYRFQPRWQALLIALAVCTSVLSTLEWVANDSWLFPKEAQTEIRSLLKSVGAFGNHSRH